MQHFSGLRDECPQGKCRIDERHKVRRPARKCQLNHGSALSFASDGTSNYVINAANDPSPCLRQRSDQLYEERCRTHYSCQQPTALAAIVGRIASRQAPCRTGSMSKARHRKLHVHEHWQLLLPLHGTCKHGRRFDRRGLQQDFNGELGFR